MSNANVPASLVEDITSVGTGDVVEGVAPAPPSVEGITELVGSDLVEGFAPSPPLVEGVTTLVGDGGVIDEPSQEKSKETGTRDKAEKKAKKRLKYFISVPGRRLKKSKPFKLTWKILRGIGKAIWVVVRNVSQILCILVFGIIFGAICFIIFELPLCLVTVYVVCCPVPEGLAHKLRLAGLM